MKFDELHKATCVLPQPGEVSCTVGDGAPNPPVNEDPQLVLRPEVAIVAVLGNVQYRTFVIANGVEREVTSGLTYMSANTGLALIGAIGGNATGVAEGIVTIGVTWQGLEAFAQLQIVASCDAVSTGMMVVIDRSESMSQPFGGAYGTKLDFAKLLAKQFIGEVNVIKDKVGLVQFGNDAQVLEALTDDNVAVATTLMGVQFAPVETDITSGLKGAIDNLIGVDRRVIVLFTDGGHNDDVEPLSIAQQFRSGGGVLVVVALRAGMAAFMRAEKLASGGFFISAYDSDTAEDAKGYISGVKGYLCAGNCCPEGDKIVGSGKLNYADFENWDVTANEVDLIGKGLFDLIPGNGLYVDLVGSGPGFQGGLRTQRTFLFEAGDIYRLTYKLAGNQRANAVPFSVRITAGSLVNNLRGMNDWRQDFTVYTETFIGDHSTGKLAFVSETIPSGSIAQSFGILLDSVMLENMTTGMIVFKDAFDDENVTYIPPACGPGTMYGQGGNPYGYAYGYCCYGYGCLSEPIKAQNPDPNPPTDPEVENPPQTFTATQSYTASPPAGTTGPDVTREATYTSLISMADAITHALALARAAAEAAAAAGSRSTLGSGQLFNIDIGIGIGTATEKVGTAALGSGAEDFWNSAGLFDSPLLKADGQPSTSFLRIVPVVDFTDPVPGRRIVAYHETLAHDDKMYQTAWRFMGHNDATGDTTPQPWAYAIHGLDPGTYTLAVYAHGPEALANSEVFVRTGTLQGTPGTGYTWNPAGATSWGAKEHGGADYLAGAWIEDANFVKFNITVGAAQDTVLIQFGAGGTVGVFGNGLQLLRLT